MKKSNWMKMFVLACVFALAASCGSSSNGDEDTKAGEDTTETDVLAEVGEEDLVEADLAADAADAAVDPDTAADPDTAVEPDLAEDVVQPPPVHPLFAAPEGVLVYDDKVYVTNTNGAYNADLGKMIYGPGYVTVLNTKDFSYYGQFETPYQNPQYLLIADERLVVVCSGTAEMDENWVMSPDTPGGVVLYDPDTLESLGDVAIPAGTPEPMGGFPGAAAYAPAEDLLLTGSGTSGFLYVVDLTNLELQASMPMYGDAGAANDIILPAVDGAKAYAASFNRGKVYSYDLEKEGEGPAFDVTETDELEGPTDVLIVDEVLYVLNSLSSSVAALDMGTGKVTFPLTTGAVPNRLAHSGGSLFVVNSVDNNLTKYDIDSGEVTQSFASFDPGTNPWDMAVADGAGYVTGYMTNNLVKVDLTTGDIVAAQGND